MIFDKKSLLSDAQAITADAASTNVYDSGAHGTPVGASAPLGRDHGKGCKIPLRIQVVEGFNNLTSLAVQVQVDDNEAFNSPKVVMTHTALVADLVAGYVFPIDTIPLGTNERYLRLYYDVTGSAPSTGKITAGVTAGNQTAPL